MHGGWNKCLCQSCEGNRVIPGIAGLPAGMSSAGAPVYNWSAATLPNHAGASDGWANFTLRQNLGSSYVPINGNYVRLSFTASDEPLAISVCYVGLKGAGLFDFSTTPQQVRFNGGSASVTISAGQTQYSDPVALVITTSNPVIVSVYVPNNTAQDKFSRFSTAAVQDHRVGYITGNDAATVAASGYTTNPTYDMYLQDFEVSP